MKFLLVSTSISKLNPRFEINEDQPIKVEINDYLIKTIIEMKLFDLYNI